MVKSSSLESLHNIVSHSIKRDVVGGKGAGMRGMARAPPISPSLSHPVTSGIIQSKSVKFLNSLFISL